MTLTLSEDHDVCDKYRSLSQEIYRLGTKSEMQPRPRPTTRPHKHRWSNVDLDYVDFNRGRGFTCT